ncbi:MAG: Enoyl-CoA hydratase/isomerase [Solirubrobacterales bacterium]|nr:Enoyl-CoA hydratase/isomerase [Solirubrobacterales bacterium]
MPDGVRLERDGAVAALVLDRPERRNALTDHVLELLADHATACDLDPDIRCIVVEGGDEVFAAGADVRALSAHSAVEIRAGERARHWDVLRRVRTPIVAGVSGLCLGGGCELAMLADVVIASTSARFGLPETGLGLVPGAGGTQLLPRAVGKAIAMDVALTGRLLSAEEAERAGLVSRVVAPDEWRSTAHKLAARIASRPAVAQQLAKELIAASFETPLQAGLAAERSGFAVAFSSEDAREGMSAFLEKRDPAWRHR